MANFYSIPTPSENYFDRLLKEGSLEIKEYFQKEINYLKANIKPHSRILDVGCGFGRHMKLLAPSAKEVIGIDNNEDMIKRAEQYLAGVNNTRLFVQDAEKLEFADGSFDYVICMSNTFGNFCGGKLSALGEMKRVCKKEGKVVVSVYSEDAFEFRKRDYVRIGMPITKAIDGRFYVKEKLISEQFTKLQLERLFSSAGLKSRITKLTPISYLCEATPLQ